MRRGRTSSAVEEVRIPAAYSRLFRTQYDWNYVTIPQERAGARPVYWPSGKVLGGSSTINAMTYVRGHRDDYDDWRSTYGCTGWGYNDLFPYFRRAEDNSRGASQYHGAGGPMPVQDLRHKSEHAQLFIEAAIRRGALANDDFNGAQQDGVGFYQVTQRDGVRCSVADAYLASKPQNLTVTTNAVATGLVIEGGRAAGVTYRCQGREETARAAAEVDPRRGRGRDAAAADAVRHRARGPPAGARHLRNRRHARRGREPDGPPGRARPLVDPAGEGPVGVHQEPRPGPVADDPQGPAHL